MAYSEVNVWKIGSNWGNRGDSVASCFLDNNIVFFGGVYDGKKRGDYRNVKVGDLILISEGSTPIAIAQATSIMRLWKDAISVDPQLQFRISSGAQIYLDEDAVFCNAHIEILPPNMQFKFDSRKRFCSQKDSLPIIEWWIMNEQRNTREEFDIASYTLSLFKGDKQRCIEPLFDSSKRYRIPIYQRPYSWSENQISRLLDDLTRALEKGEPLFVGTIQLSSPIPLNRENTLKRYDVIDGQQRLTTFLILSILLEESFNEPLFNNKLYKDILKSSVNRGEAEKEFREFLECCTDLPNEFANNAYIRNAIIIKEWLDSNEIDLEKLQKFLKSDLRFVVIETKAGLSKTLEIFNTINTTGLDLSGADLFKIRFYEYLTTIKKFDDSVFNEISELYRKVAQYNKEHTLKGLWGGEMRLVLEVLQDIIIARYSLSKELYRASVEKFFIELFDSLLAIRIHPNWSKSLIAKIIEDSSDDAPLSVNSISRLIDCFFKTQKLLSFPIEATQEELHIGFMLRLMKNSSYHQYTSLITVYLYQAYDKEKLEYFVHKILKISFCFSLFFSKEVKEGKYVLLEILSSLVSSQNLDSIFNTSDNIFSKEMFRDHIYQLQVTSKMRWKNLLCKLCEYQTMPDYTHESLSRLFDSPTDIEHIQSFTPNNETKEIRSAFDDVIHHLGNLVILEADINRSIKNNKIEDKQTMYQRSKFHGVLALVNSTWDIEKFRSRHHDEIAKVVNFLFD